MRTSALLATGLALATLAATAGCGFLGGDEPADLQVYSARHYGSEEVFKQFTEETGITVDFLGGENAELLERIKAEGDDSPADVYMTVDAGNLWNASDQGLLQPLDSPTLDKAVPQQYRDSQDRWFGLVLRARTVLYNPDNVDESELDPKDTYAGLADPRWRGRICMRDTSEAYTVSLVASLIDLHGRDKALDIVEGWVANDVDVMPNDVLLIDAVDAGTCDVALVNHYYLARELEDAAEPEREALLGLPGGCRHAREPLRRRGREVQRQQGPGPGADRVAGHRRSGRHDRRQPRVPGQRERPARRDRPLLR